MPTSATPSSRYLLCAILVMGFGYRVAHPERIAIEHFDEGVYASNYWFQPEQNYSYPMRRYYAPPLLPTLIEACMIVAPNSPLAPFWPSLLLGSLTPLVCWWFAQRWWGARIALPLAALAATSDVHLAFSRFALTDVPACLFMLLAVGLFLEANRGRSYRLALAAGMATGLAWWTKYNGWLPLGIAAGGIVVSGLGERRPFSEWVRLAKLWSVMAGVAGLAGLLLVAAVGGFSEYALITQNHRQYLVGFSGWMASLLRQAENLRYLDSPLGACGLTVAWATQSFLTDEDSRATSAGGSRSAGKSAGDSAREQTFFFGSVPLVLAAALALGTVRLLVLLILVLVIVRCWDAVRRANSSPVKSSTQSNAPRPDRLVASCIAVWFVGLFIATPFYAPYLRLALPWSLATWFVGANCLTNLQREMRTWLDRRPSPALGKGWLLAAWLLAGSLVWLQWSEVMRGVVAWQDRAGLARIATDIAQRIRPILRDEKAESWLWLNGEPALYFQLRTRGVFKVAPVDPLGEALERSRSVGVTSLVVVGPHTRRSPSAIADWQAVSQNFRRLADYPYAVSDLVRLDTYAISEFASSASDRVEVFQELDSATGGLQTNDE